MFKLDYSLDSLEQRKQLVEQIINDTPEEQLTERYLEILADYLVLCMEKQEKREKKILTDNRMNTVNKREISFEGLASQLENGEDGLYSMMTDDKQTIFQPKVTITEEDLQDIPPLAQLRQAINQWEAKLKTVEGKEAYIIKKALIEMRKDQYVIKNAYRKPIVPNKLTRSSRVFKLEDTTHEFDENGLPVPEGVSLMNPKICSAILCNYSKLKENSWDNFENDTWYLIYDFEVLCDTALEQYPLYQKIVEYKIDGKSNFEIQELIQMEFGINHSVEYISSLWRNKIPKILAAEAEKQYLNWYYTMKEKGKYKKCSRCGEVKLANNKFYSRNKASKDGFYSICKQCRNSPKAPPQLVKIKEVAAAPSPNGQTEPARVSVPIKSIPL